MRSYQQFFAELKRRKVFRVMAVYGIVGFVVLQVVDLAVPALLLPEWTYRLIALILLVGFPVAIVLAWAFETTPEGLQRTERAEPGEIEAIVAEPASRRWQSGLLALAGMTALVLGAYWVGTRTGADSATAESVSPDPHLAPLSTADDDERPSIAVLPFVNMSGDREQEILSDGMTEEIGTVLWKTGQFRVQGRTSAFAYKGDTNLRKIGSELGVGYLIEGSVRKDGNDLKITASLIDAANAETLWSDSYERPEGDMFDIQAEIAVAIADALEAPLGLDVANELVTPTGDLDAYDLYLAGRSAMRKRGRESMLEAVRLFEAAIALDSAFAPAWASLAESLEISVWYVGDTSEVDPELHREVSRLLGRSEVAARRALALDPDNASAFVALASVHRDRAQWSEAEQLYRRALEVDPESAEAHQQYAELLAHRGRIAEAVRRIDRAAWLDPAPVRLLLLVYFLGYDNRWDEALEVLRYGVERDADYPDPEKSVWVWSAAQMFARSGDSEEAVRAMDRWLQEDPPADSAWTRESLESTATGLAVGELERLDDWELGSRELMWIGKTDSAVVRLVKRNAITNLGLPYDPYVWSPEFDAVRSDPRVRDYMESVGLSDAALHRTPVEERTRPRILNRP